MAGGWKSSYFRYKEVFLNVSAAYKKRADLRAFLEIVLSIVAVIIFLMFALKPTALTIISLFQQIKEEKETLSALTQKVADLKKAQTLLSQNQAYLNDVYIAVASAPAPELFSKQIQGLAAKDGVELASLSINDVVLVGPVKTSRVSAKTQALPGNANEMGYSISIRGSFTNMYNFLKDLENLRIVSAIDTVAINSSITEAGRAIVAVISGKIPYLGSDQ
jgi:cell division protein FtsB